MKNYVQPGHVVTVTAPAGGVTSGDPILVGSLFGVCATDADAGAPVELAVSGVFEIPAADGATFAEGAAVYFDGTEATDVDTDTFIGHALVTATGTVTVRLSQ